MENYHTHTYRCNHAKGEDRDYVLRAIDEGFTLLGFSDHTPWPYQYTAVHRNRMYPSQLEDYVTSIKSLREEFRDQIDIRLGLEVEAFTDYYPWLEEKVHQYGHLKKPCDLLPAAMGGPLDATVYTSYLKKKFTELYKL